MNTDAMHPLTSAYLQELEVLARRLPPDQARELVEDIREHVASALRPDSPETDVRATLDRLGSPAEVVAAAAGPETAAPALAGPRWGAVETGTIVCLVVAEVLFILWPLAALVWVAGVVLLIVSKLWTAPEKTLATFGLALAFPLLTVVLAIGTVGSSSSWEVCSGSVSGDGGEPTTCTTGSDGPSYAWVALALAVAYLAFQAYTIWRLMRARRRTADLSPAGR